MGNRKSGLAEILRFPYQNWLYSTKPASWLKTLLPYFFGSSWMLNFHKTEITGSLGRGQFPILIHFGLCFGSLICLTLIIVWLNDWADIRVDRIKRKLFQFKSSPKTIPDGILSPREVLVGGLGAIFLYVLLGVSLAFYWDRFSIFLFSLGSLGIFFFYSFPPLKLNYRGGGEFLEAAGIGIFLPVFQFYPYLSWEGSLLVDPSLLFSLICLFLMGLSSAIASGLSDQITDRMGGKRTVVLLIGNKLSRKLIVWISILSLTLFWYIIQREFGFLLNFDPEGSQGVLLFGTRITKTQTPSFAVLLAIGIVLLHQARMIFQIIKDSRKATIRNFPAQKRFKSSLHNFIWFNTGYLSLIPILRILI